MSINKLVQVFAEVRILLLNFVECEDELYGCIKCQEQNAFDRMTFATCSQCAYGLYLLSNKTITSKYPENYSFCVPDCQLAHSSFINNDVDGNCLCIFAFSLAVQGVESIVHHAIQKQDVNTAKRKNKAHLG